MKHKIFLLVFLAAATFPGSRAAGLPGKAARPNVLFFLVDDLGWSDPGYAGSRFYETPHIDQLARDGRVFTNAYAPAPVCSPTRAAIMTGKYPVRTGITDYIGAPQQAQWKRNTRLLPPDYTTRLALEEVTLAEAFREGGYSTYFAGKWHLGPEGYWPENQGFEINFGGVDKGNPGKGYFAPYRNPRLQDGPEGEYLPERLARETVSFVRRQKESSRPFLIYHSFYLVHTPLLPKKELEEKYKVKKKASGLEDEFKTIGEDVYDSSKERQARVSHSHPGYAAMVEALDNAVGSIIDALKEEGLYENTIIVFTSDNGGLSTSEGQPTGNEPLRAGKGWPYEGGVKVPLIVRWPGGTGSGSVSDQLVVSTDFYPTLLEAAGLPLRPKQHTDGISFVPVLKGKKGERHEIFWHYPHYGNQGGAPYSAVREGNYKLIRFYEKGGYYELYNLEKDPSETTDLSGKEKKTYLRLQKKLEGFLRETAAAFPAANPGHKERP